MRKFLIGVAVFIVGFVSAIILTHGSLCAENSSDNSAVMEKLSEVARSQQNILATLNALKEDIQIIKIRVTQIQ